VGGWWCNGWLRFSPTIQCCLYLFCKKAVCCAESGLLTVKIIRTYLSCAAITKADIRRDLEPHCTAEALAGATSLFTEGVEGQISSRGGALSRALTLNNKQKGPPTPPGNVLFLPPLPVPLPAKQQQQRGNGYRLAVW